MKEIKEFAEMILVAIAACILGYIIGIAQGIWSQQDLETRKTEEIVETVSFGTVEREDKFSEYEQVWFHLWDEDYRIVLPIKANQH